jgi:protein-L-isoaspartate O-methyltransferase
LIGGVVGGQAGNGASRVESEADEHPGGGITRDDESFRRWAFDGRRADAVHLLGSLRGKRVLVVQSGIGLVADQLAEYGAHVVATETDYRYASFTARRLRRRGNDHQLVLRGVLDELPLRRGTFDLAVVANSIERAERTPGEDFDAKLVGQAVEFLHPDGRMLVLFRAKRLRRLARAVARRPDHAAVLRNLLAPQWIATDAASVYLDHAQVKYVVERAQNGRGLAFLIRSVVELGQRHRFLPYLQAALRRARFASVLTFATEAQALVVQQSSNPREGPERVILSGYRPFGDFAVVASLGPAGPAEKFEKIARSADARARLRRELDGLRAAARTCAPDVLLPRVLAADDDRLAVTALPGTRVASLINRRESSITRAAVAVGQALGRIASREASFVPVERVVFDPVLGLEDQRQLVEEARRLTGASLMVGFAHGDLQPSNVVIGSAGEVGVIDWEYATGSVPIGFDLLFFLTEITRFMRPSPRLEREFPIAVALRPAVDAFVKESGLDSQSLEGYVPLFLATRAVRQNAADDVRQPRKPTPTTSS